MDSGLLQLVALGCGCGSLEAMYIAFGYIDPFNIVYNSDEVLVSGFGVVCVVFWLDGGGVCVFCVSVVVLSLLAGLDCSKVYMSLGCSRCGL